MDELSLSSLSLRIIIVIITYHHYHYHDISQEQKVNIFACEWTAIALYIPSTSTSYLLFIYSGSWSMVIMIIIVISSSLSRSNHSQDNYRPTTPYSFTMVLGTWPPPNWRRVPIARPYVTRLVNQYKTIDRTRLPSCSWPMMVIWRGRDEQKTMLAVTNIFAILTFPI